MKGVGSCHEFLEKFRDRIRVAARKALRFMGCTDPESHSEDVASDVAGRVIKYWDGLDSPEHALYKIIVNAARDHLKVCRAEVAQEIDDSASPCFVQAGQDPEEMLSDALLIKELLSLLNQTERHVIQLWFYGHSLADIGEILGMRAGSVRSIKSRAVVKMRKIAVS